MEQVALVSPAGRSLTVRGRHVAVTGPSISDPRLHVAATIVTLHVLGQTHLGFAVSIPQILVALGTCGGAELVVRLVRERVLAWPASGFLAGNGIAFLLRVEGTVPGDRWSWHGWWVFAGTGLVAVAARFLARVGGRPLWNPSNVALVACFVLLGTRRVNPLDLWWAPMSWPMALAYVVLAVGGAAVTVRTRMWPVTVVFVAVFALANAVVARSGHCMVARWNLGPVCDAHYWWVLTTSPEVVIFACFMITDPRSAPQGRVARAVYAAAVGVLAAGLAATQAREFGTKVAILASLTVVCTCRPVLEALVPAAGSAADRFWSWVSSHRDGRRPTLGMVRLATVSMCSISGVLALAGLRPSPEDARLPLDRGSPDVVLVAAPIVPDVVVDTEVARAGVSISSERARAMAQDLFGALDAIDAALDGTDVVTVRSMVSRRHLASIEEHFGTGADRIRVDALTLSIARASDDPQAPPELALRAEVTRIADGTRAERTFTMVEARGRWVLDDVAG